MCVHGTSYRGYTDTYSTVQNEKKQSAVIWERFQNTFLYKYQQTFLLVYITHAEHCSYPVTVGMNIIVDGYSTSGGLEGSQIWYHCDTGFVWRAVHAGPNFEDRFCHGTTKVKK